MGTRAEKVSERIRVEIAEMLMRGDVHDPRLKGAVISGVRVTGDLGQARVFVRVFDGDNSPERQAKVTEAFDSATGFIRRELAKSLGLRRTPTLIFVWDGSVDSALRIEGLLDRLKAARKDAPEE